MKSIIPIVGAQEPSKIVQTRVVPLMPANNGMDNNYDPEDGWEEPDMSEECSLHDEGLNGKHEGMFDDLPFLSVPLFSMIDVCHSTTYASYEYAS
jgi:hypothetical protein